MNKQILNSQIMDTHKVIGTLTKEHNLDSNQAEGIVNAILQGQNLSIQGLATKEDIGDVRKEISEVNLKLSADIAEVNTKLSADIAEVRQEISEVKLNLSTDIAQVGKEVGEIKSQLKLLLWILPVTLTGIGLVATLVLKFL